MYADTHMSFFDTYDTALINADTQSDVAYRRRFLRRWNEPDSLFTAIHVHPIHPSPAVTPPVMALEHELMQTKCAIDAFHEFDTKKEKYYNQVTRIIDPFSFYKKIAQRQVSPERSMTNAWFKCWEMIHVFQLVPHQGHIKLFCNAELPGAFLFALNHYIKTKTRTTYDWVANSLYPSDGSILGDEFGLVRRYQDRWMMSREHNGDVIQAVMIQRMEDRCQRSVDLYTSDIGIGMDHETFLKQEEMEAPLNLGQIICGMRTLREGGHLVCKTFMFFSPFSMSLLYLTSQCFDEFCVYKPETSRAANSEVYLVGKGYHWNDDILAKLMHTLTTWDAAYMNEYMVPVPEDFYLTMVLALNRIYRRQMRYIRQNIETVQGLYAAGVPADYAHVSATPFWKNEQVRLAQWRKRFNIPFLSSKEAL